MGHKLGATCATKNWPSSLSERVPIPMDVQQNKRAFQALLMTGIFAVAMQGSVGASESEWTLTPSNVSVAESTDSSYLDDSTKDTIRTIASSLAIVLGTFLLLVALFRKRTVSAVGSNVLETLGQIQVTPKVNLHLVRFGPRLLVLHIKPDKVDTIAELTDAEEVERLLQHHGDDARPHPQVDELLDAVRPVPASSRGLFG